MTGLEWFVFGWPFWNFLANFAIDFVATISRGIRQARERSRDPFR